MVIVSSVMPLAAWIAPCCSTLALKVRAFCSVSKTIIAWLLPQQTALTQTSGRSVDASCPPCQLRLLLSLFYLHLDTRCLCRQRLCVCLWVQRLPIRPDVFPYQSNRLQPCRPQ